MKNFKNFRGNSGTASRDRSLGEANTGYQQYSYYQSSEARNQTVDSSNPYAKYLSPSITGYNTVSAAHAGSTTPERSIHNNEFYSKCSNEKAGTVQPADQSLICQTCELPFNESFRAPRIMPCCNHCFCQQCLMAAFERVQLIQENKSNMSLNNMMDPVSYFISDKGKLQCPEDEIELDASIRSVQSLRKNFNLIQKIMGQRQMPVAKAAATEQYGLTQSQHESDPKQYYFDTSASVKQAEKKKFKPSSGSQIQANGPLSQQLYDQLTAEAGRQNAGTTMGFSKNFSPDVNKLSGNVNQVAQVVVREENSPFARARGDTSQLSTHAQFKQSFHGDTESTKPFGHVVNKFNRMQTPRHTMGKNPFRSNSRGNQNTQLQAAPQTHRFSEAGGFNIKLHQMEPGRHMSQEKTVDEPNVSKFGKQLNLMIGSSPDQSRNTQQQLGFRHTINQPKVKPLSLDIERKDVGMLAPQQRIQTPTMAQKMHFNYRSNDAKMGGGEQQPYQGIGHGPMHGSIINHLRDSPLKQTVQQRIIMNNNHLDNDGYYEMVMEEDDEGDDESVKLRRDSLKSKALDNTAKSNLKATGGKNRQRVEQMQQHNWHKKFQAYKETQKDEKIIDMKAALNQQLMGLKQSFVQQNDEFSFQGAKLGQPERQPRPMEVQPAEVVAAQTCAAHDKPKELICLTCRDMVCHTCALFGDHKGHDVREKVDTMKEIEVRTEVLMEMFEQMDQEVEKLQQDTHWQVLRSVMIDRKNHLKNTITNKFNDWKELLNKMEFEAHLVVEQRFQKYEDLFTEEAGVLKEVEEENRLLMIKMGDILNNYMNEIERNADYVSFDILESDVNNPSSVEAMYQQIEKFIIDNIKVVQFNNLQNLEDDYDKIYAWFGKGFEQKIDHLVQVIDKEHPLRVPLDADSQIMNNSKSSVISDQKSGKEDLKNKFKNYKNSFQKDGRSQSKNKNQTMTTNQTMQTNQTITDENKNQNQNNTNVLSANSFEDDNKNISGSNANDQQKKEKSGVIMFENVQGVESNVQNEQLAATTQVTFENSAVSLKMEDIDFYKLSMIAGGGNDQSNDQKLDLNHESIKEVVQQQVQAALQQQQETAKMSQTDFLKQLQMLMQAATNFNQDGPSAIPGAGDINNQLLELLRPKAKVEKIEEQKVPDVDVEPHDKQMAQLDNNIYTDEFNAVETKITNENQDNEDEMAVIQNSSNKKSFNSSEKPPKYVVSNKLTKQVTLNLQVGDAAGAQKKVGSRENSANRSQKKPVMKTITSRKADTQNSDAEDSAVQTKQEDSKIKKVKEKTSAPQEAEKKEKPAAAKGKQKFNLAESFKTQALIGDIDLSGRGLTDNHCHQICTLLKQHAKENVDNLDLGNNKITDIGILELCKALAETEVTRLVISSNKLTDNCCQQVTGVLMRNKHLTILNMQDNQITSRVAKNKLVNALPKIDVVI